MDALPATTRPLLRADTPDPGSAHRYERTAGVFATGAESAAVNNTWLCDDLTEADELAGSRPRRWYRLGHLPRAGRFGASRGSVRCRGRRVRRTRRVGWGRRWGGGRGWGAGPRGLGGRPGRRGGRRVAGA